MGDKETRPIIGVDAMGGDHGPAVVVPGALSALAELAGCDLVLYGDEQQIAAVMEKVPGSGSAVRVVHCSQDIAMTEAAAAAIRNKPDSPIVRAMADLKKGQIQGVVSAGSTGAMVAASLIILGRLPGIDRPAIATLIPTVRGEILLLDAGANVQCTPAHLVTFARMGSVYSSEILGVAQPRIGQLSIGSEPKKGMELNIAAYELLAASGLNFVGNIEGNNLLLDPCDVVITDGFTGNNTLKLVEGFQRFLGGISQREDLSQEEKLAFGLILKYMQNNFSYEAYGGAALLGVAGVSIIAHGRSSSLALANAVKVAWEQVRADLPAKLTAAQS